MTVAPRMRKALLTAHVVASVGWIGAAATFAVLAAVGLGTGGEPVTRSVYVAMDPIARFVLVPLAASSVASGMVQALGTHWGLLRHYWVVVKLVVTVVAAGVLLLQLRPIALVAEAAAAGPLAASDLRQERLSLLLHSGVGTVVLLVPAALSVFKPRGRTRRGRRMAAGA